MRLLLLLVALFFAFAKLSANVEDKIESAQVKIDSKKSLQIKLSGKLQRIADDIKKHKNKLTLLSSHIQQTKDEIQRLKKAKKIKKSELLKLQKIYNKLLKKEKIVSKKVVDIISRELSIAIITGDYKSDENSSNDVMEDDIVQNEVLKRYVELLRKNFKKTKSKYIRYNKNIDLVRGEILKYAKKESLLKEKQKTLLKLTKTQKESIKSLESQKRNYLKKLNQIKIEQNELVKTLNKLNITKLKLEKSKIKLTSTGVNVRQIGSSYQQSKLVKYRGKKTIPPLKNYSVVQNFGTYIDPIYKMKIFNDGLILRAKRKHAKVVNVLDGTVVYAQKTPVMGGMVIVKHKNSMHTIYGHLIEIAPNVRVGKRLKKGYVIGRINKDLTFQATVNGKLINPARLIR